MGRKAKKAAQDAEEAGYAQMAAEEVKQHDALLATAAEAVRGCHQHKGMIEQLEILRGELGRLRRRLADAEALAKLHAHEAHGEPPARMGVHIDSQGRYFMRRPDGFHRMYVMANLAVDGPRGHVQRLAEKDD